MRIYFDSWESTHACTSMNELGGARGSSGGEILPLDETDTEPSGDSIERHAGAGGAAADDEHV